MLFLIIYTSHPVNLNKGNESVNGREAKENGTAFLKEKKVTAVSHYQYWEPEQRGLKAGH